MSKLHFIATITAMGLATQSFSTNSHVEDDAYNQGKQVLSFFNSHQSNSINITEGRDPTNGNVTYSLNANIQDHPAGSGITFSPNEAVSVSERRDPTDSKLSYIIKIVTDKKHPAGRVFTLPKE